MRKIAIPVPDNKCRLCKWIIWAQLQYSWTCPARTEFTEVILDNAKPVKACREAEVSQ